MSVSRSTVIGELSKMIASVRKASLENPHSRPLRLKLAVLEYALREVRDGASE